MSLFVKRSSTTQSNTTWSKLGSCLRLTLLIEQSQVNLHWLE